MNQTIKIKTWRIEEETGYKPFTTCFEDLSIAEPFGLSAINQTINNFIKYYKNNIKFMTELYLALNWKIWQHYKTKVNLAKYYDNQYNKLYDIIIENKNFSEEDLKYFYRTID